MNPEFTAQTRSAYDHLYDLTYLRTHPLMALMPSASLQDINTHAWNLHHLLVNAIHQLDPGPNAPVFSREWRRYRLLERHFVDGIDPQELSSELNISRRQYYRELNLAIEALADTLAILLNLPSSDNPETGSFHFHTQPEGQPPLAGEARCPSALLETVQGGLQILEQLLIQKGISIELAIPAETPPVSASAGLLRQILLSMLGFLANQPDGQAIVIRAEQTPEAVELFVGVRTGLPIAAPEQRPWEEMAHLEELEIHFEPQRPEQAFRLRLPLAAIRRVLALDDNADILQLYQRFLSAHRYQLFAETHPQQALELAARLQPDVILLDLMMPGVDGWDVLQTLAHIPETSAIPVIVCSILPQKELAHSLGAAAFLQKPIGESALIEMIRSLICD